MRRECAIFGSSETSVSLWNPAIVSKSDESVNARVAYCLSYGGGM